MVISRSAYVFMVSRGAVMNDVSHVFLFSVTMVKEDKDECNGTLNGLQIRIEILFIYKDDFGFS